MPAERKNLHPHRLDYVDLRGSTGSDSVSTTPLSTPLAERAPETVKTTTPDESYGSVADKCSASVPHLNIGMPSASGTDRSGAGSGAAGPGPGPIFTLPPPPSTAPPPPLFYGLSPKLEMRLALNHDILGDEDLISYNPGPDHLTSILGPDLSTYHRISGKDVIMNRIISRVNSYSSIPVALAKHTAAQAQAQAQAATSSNNPSTSQHNNNNTTTTSDHPLRNGTSSSYQQNNSKMDTPTPNRRKAQSPATWSSSGSVEREEKTLSDLERLARREKVYCMTQLNQNGSPHLKHTASFNKSKTSKLFTFLSRRNSENQLHRFFSTSKDSGDGSGCGDVPTSHSDSSRMNSPRKDNDKSLDRRFWKQLTKRRRNSLNELSASES